MSISAKQLTVEEREARAKYHRDWRAKKKAKKIKRGQGAAAVRRRAQVQKVAAIVIEKPSLSLGNAIREAGLPEHLALHPSTLTNTKEWSEILDEYLPQTEVAKVHAGLLKAARIDHLIFTRDGEPTDEEIKLMLEEVGCTLRKIVHGEQVRHAYFFAPDNLARKNALDMVYKMRGSYVMDKAAVAFSLAALAQSRDALSPPVDAPNALPPAPSNTPSLPPAPSNTPSLPRAVDSEEE